MRAKDWEILKVGDRLIRDTHSRVEPRTVRANTPARVESDTFQIVQIRNGVVTAVRLLRHAVMGGVKTVATETVELTREMAVAPFVPPAPEALASPRSVTYEWRADFSQIRGEARLTGGFTVQRADGSIEYERSPTDTTR